jgi:hypothetical protein
MFSWLEIKEGKGFAKGKDVTEGDLQIESGKGEREEGTLR